LRIEKREARSEKREARFEISNLKFCLRLVRRKIAEVMRARAGGEEDGVCFVGGRESGGKESSGSESGGGACRVRACCGVPSRSSTSCECFRALSSSARRRAARFLFLRPISLLQKTVG
jgi:hypothetical protein